MMGDLVADYTDYPTAYPTLSPVESIELEESEPLTIFPSDDSYVVKGSPDANFGTSPVLKVKGLAGSPNAHDSLIKFVIPPSGAAPVEAAFFKIYSIADAPHGGVFYYEVDADPWSESSVTWDTSPDYATRISNIGAVEAEQWYTMDIFTAVDSLNGNGGTITFRIRSRNAQMAQYSSKEGDDSPEIFIAYGSEPQGAVVTPPVLELEVVTQSDLEVEMVETVAESMPDNDTPAQTPGPTRSPTTPRPTSAPTKTGLYILNPSDDATIVGDHPDDNHGYDESLQVDDDSGQYDSLLKFELPDIDTSKIASATLRLYCMDGSDSGGIIGRTSFSNWVEGDVTWNTAPAGVGSPLHQLESVNIATWYEIDVLDLIPTGGNSNVVSMRMTSKSWNRAGYSSKEGPEPPELVIQMAEEEEQVFPDAQSSGGLSGMLCTADSRRCPDGSFVSRVASDGCNFAPCSESAPVETVSTGLFFPVWGTGGDVACVDSVAPSWARGAYLKESKSACCKAYFMLQVDECLET
jgi:hypothetical protein